MPRRAPFAVVVATGSVPCGKHPGRLALELEIDCIKQACAGAGIRPKDIEALVLVPPGYRTGFSPIRAQRVMERLGCRPKAALEVDIGGMSALAALHIAVMEIEAGRVEVAAVAGAQAERSELIDASEMDRLVFLNSMFGPWLGPFGVVGALPFYAMSAQRYIHEHDLSPEEVAEVVVLLRRHASRNPKAELREPVTVEEVLASRVISPPIHLFESAPWSDGACAVVVASDRWAAARGLEGAAITGWGEVHSPTSFLPFHEDLTTFPWIGDATREALERAGRALDDVDLAEVYGPFASSEVMTYEAMGFFSPGEAPRAVAEGRTTYGGDLVINPSGGRICFGHPPPATPLYEVEELYLQLTGQAGDRQVEGAQIGMSEAEHGAMNGASVVVMEA